MQGENIEHLLVRLWEEIASVRASVMGSVLLKTDQLVSVTAIRWESGRKLNTNIKRRKSPIWRFPHLLRRSLLRRLFLLITLPLAKLLAVTIAENAAKDLNEIYKSSNTKQPAC